MTWETDECIKRTELANSLIHTISSCGRYFFSHKGSISHFKWKNGRLYFVDKYSKKELYMHYHQKWNQGFTDGGTLYNLIRKLGVFIMKGIQLNPAIFGPWPEWVCEGDLWAYGSDMNLVRMDAERLGIVEEKK